MSHGDEDVQLQTPIIKIGKLREGEQGDRGTWGETRRKGGFLCNGVLHIFVFRKKRN